MPSLSEFVSFVSEKSGIKSLELIDKDIGLHKILKEICYSNIGQNYLFKGGSCLVKCYFGYYRFSVDLDFT
jgi:predicted nucleotidyltransferase component of viral defense system